jgi:DNA-binding MarR family transcriptional regulator
MSNSSPEEQAARGEESAPLIADILAMLAAATHQVESQQNESWQWLAERSRDPLLVEALREMTVTSLRVIDAIGRLEPLNGIAISMHSGLPKGTVSKVTRRLIAQNLVNGAHRLPNHKEIYFRLTRRGRELFTVHQAFDDQMERGIVRFLERYRTDELSLLARVLREASETSFLSLGVAEPAMEKEQDRDKEEESEEPQ